MIKFVNVSKKYIVREKGSLFRKKRIIPALKDINLDIGQGITGLIGLNGAGKSTIVKLATGILQPTAGTIKVLDRNPYKHRIKNNFNIGVVFGQKTQLRWDISALDSFNLLKSIYKIKKEDFDSRLNTLIDFFDVSKTVNQPIRTLSLGQKMRMEFIAAFLHKPSLILLDEPALGLDFQSRKLVQTFLKDYSKKNNCTILLTTHDLQLVEELCDNIVIINKGSIIHNCSLPQLKKLIVDKLKVKILINEKHIQKFEKILLTENIVFKQEINVFRFELENYSSLSTILNKTTNNVIESLEINNDNLPTLINQIYDGD